MLYHAVAIINDNSNNYNTALINRFISDNNVKFVRTFEDIAAVIDYNALYENFCLFDIVFCIGNGNEIQNLIQNEFLSQTPIVIDLEEYQEVNA